MVSRLRFLGILSKLFMWTILLGLVVIVVYPLLWMVFNGFKSNPELFNSPFALPTQWSWINYQNAWNRGVGGYVTASVLVTATSAVATVFISAWAAYGLTRVKIPFGSVFLVVILGGLMLSPTVALVPLVRMFQSLGLYDTFWALLILYIAFRIPFTTLLIRAYMIDLPRELDEAAEIDGASRWYTFWHVILPLCMPVIIATILLHILFAWNEYLFAVVFTSGSGVQTLPIGLMSLQARHGTEFPVVFAGMVIAAVPIIILFFTTQRHFIKGLADGIGK